METEIKQTPSRIIKIVLFGPESTGKTSLAKALSNYFKEPWVEEYMRIYLEDKIHLPDFEFTQEHIIPIAKGQIELENKRTKQANKLLFCDTNLLQIYTYAKEYYPNYTSKILEESIKSHHYNLYLLTDIDVPWEADPLRDKPHERDKMFRIFENTLKKYKLPYICISGSLEQRIQLTVQEVMKLMKNEKTEQNEIK